MKLTKEFGLLIDDIKMRKKDMDKHREGVDKLFNLVNDKMKGKAYNGVEAIYQGSYKYDTVMKPEDNEETDVDAGAHSSDCSRIKSKDYGVKREVYNAIVSSGYQAELKNNCIEVNYQGAKIDIPVYISCGHHDDANYKEYIITGIDKFDIAKSNARGVNNYLMPEGDDNREKYKSIIFPLKHWANTKLSKSDKVPSIAIHAAVMETFEEGKNLMENMLSALTLLKKQLEVGKFKLPGKLGVQNDDMFMRYKGDKQLMKSVLVKTNNFMNAVKIALSTDSEYDAWENLKIYLVKLPKPKLEDGGDKPGGGHGGN